LSVQKKWATYRYEQGHQCVFQLHR
jgi:hypothetical protein